MLTACGGAPPPAEAAAGATTGADTSGFFFSSTSRATASAFSCSFWMSAMLVTFTGAFLPQAFTGGGAEGLARYAYPTDEEKQAMQNRAGRPYQGALAAPAEHGPLGLAFGTA